MTSIVTNLAGRRVKKAVEEHAKRYEPEDPLYVNFTDESGKPRRIKVSHFGSFPHVSSSPLLVHPQHWNTTNLDHRLATLLSPLVQRPLPPGLTKKEAKVLRKIQRRAHYLDKGFYICGLRFGWTVSTPASPCIVCLFSAVSTDSSPLYTPYLWSIASSSSSV